MENLTEEQLKTLYRCEFALNKDLIFFNNPRYANIYGVANRNTGEVITEPILQYYWTKAVNGRILVCRYLHGAGVNYLNSEGKLIYDGWFNYGTTFNREGKALVNNDGKWYLINMEGVLTEYDKYGKDAGKFSSKDREIGKHTAYLLQGDPCVSDSWFCKILEVYVRADANKIYEVEREYNNEIEEERCRRLYGKSQDHFFMPAQHRDTTFDEIHN